MKILGFKITIADLRDVLLIFLGIHSGLAFDKFWYGESFIVNAVIASLVLFGLMGLTAAKHFHVTVESMFKNLGDTPNKKENRRYARR